jgi:hypothetical protein
MNDDDDPILPPNDDHVIPPDLHEIFNADPQNLLNHLDDHGHNWLMIAAANGWSRSVEELLAIGFDIDSSNGHESAIDLAYENHFFDLVLLLLNNNAKFPRAFDAMATQHAGLIAFSLVTGDFHEHLQEQRVDDLRGLATAHPHLRHFYGHDASTFNQSAAFVAINHGLFTSYDTLIACNVSLAHFEIFSDAIEALNDTQRELLREIHARHAVTLPESHLMVIRGSIFVSHDQPEADREQLLRIAHDAFDDLNDDPKMRPVFKLIGRAGGFKVIFDFRRDHIQFVDPGSDQQSRGVYTTRHIYIGARGLLGEIEDARNDVKATLAHEITHFAMDLTYDNKCKPFARNAPRAVKVEFRRVLDHCHVHKGKEPIVEWAFTSSDINVRLAEIIVRVPHMRARYANDQRRLFELRDIFRPLFDFFDNREKFYDARMRKMAQRDWVWKVVAVCAGVLVLFGAFLGLASVFSEINCFRDSNCDDGEMCLDLVCMSLCAVEKCGDHAECEMERHRPVCGCVAGYRNGGNGSCEVNPGGFLMMTFKNLFFYIFFRI